MSTNFSINTFGTLTAKTGRKLTFTDFDKNGDNVISSKEYNSVVKDMELDKVSLSKIDTDGDRKISSEEFKLWQDKIELQSILNDNLAILASNPNLSSGDKSAIKSDLEKIFKEYIDSLQSSGSGVKSDFKSQIEQKMNKLVQTTISSTQNAAKEFAVSAIVNQLASRLKSKVHSDNDMVDNDELYNSVLEKFKAKLQTLSEEFIKNYEGTTLQYDLEYYLRKYLETSDKDKLQNKAGSLLSTINALREENDDENNTKLKDLKDKCEELLKIAIDENVVIKLKGLNILTETAIKGALLQYTDYKTLLSDIKSAINDLSTKSNEDTIIENEITNAEQLADRIFLNFKGSNYQIDTTKVDLSWLYAKYGVSSKEEFEKVEIHERGKGWEGSRNKAYDEGVKILNSDELKSQIKAQIQEVLQAQNIPFSRIETVFENVYNDTVVETLNVEDMITGRGARGLSSKGHAYINIQKMLNTFMDKFNINIEKAVDSMNRSQLDLDTVDMDFSTVGGGCAEHGEDFAELYKTGKETTVTKNGPEYYVSIASKILDTLKEQLIEKAKKLCNANNVKFDETLFNTMFEESKVAAIDKAVTGVDEEGRSVTKMAIGAGIGVGLGIGGAIEGAALGTAVSTGLESLLGITIGTSAFGPVGFAIGATVGILGSLAFGLFGKGDPSESTLNTKLLVDTFLEDFTKNFENWINSMKY